MYQFTIRTLLVVTAFVAIPLGIGVGYGYVFGVLTLLLLSVASMIYGISRSDRVLCILAVILFLVYCMLSVITIAR